MIRPLARLGLAVIAAAASAAPGGADDLTLERIMAHPDWIGAAPEDPTWADDGAAVFFDRKVAGCEERARWRVLADGTGERVLGDGEHDPSDGGGAWSADRRWRAFVRAGDVFVRNVETGAQRQLTRTAEAEADPTFMASGARVAFRRGDRVLVRDVETGLESEPVVVELERAPEEKEEADDRAWLRREQPRQLETVREARARREAARQREREVSAADATRPPPPFFLGERLALERLDLSPSGCHALVVVAPRRDDAKGVMPTWVTESGDVETREVRAKVGAGEEPGVRLLLLDLVRHEKHELATDALPGIDVDPLAELRAQARARRAERAAGDDRKVDDEEAGNGPDKGRKEGADAGRRRDVTESPKRRPVGVLSVTWNRPGTEVAVVLRARDNKDRWIATVDLAGGRLVPRHRLHDPAWINWGLNDAGWLADEASLWFLSEETGWSQLFVLRPGAARPLQLTGGRSEVSQPTPTRDGAWIYFRASRPHPGIHEVFRVSPATLDVEQVTHLGGRNAYVLSPDERRLLVTHSESWAPPELFLQEATPGAPARRLTLSTSPAFREIAWTAPRFVTIPSRHGAAPAHARLYVPADAAAAPRPAVLFIHGAGYLQDAHQGWSSYFREHMFATLLARRGHVVLDVDYRGSAGYGRDWRTAIYRRMGHPELEDLEDAVAWLQEHERVDPTRVGAFGGSYGGFLVLMALFRRPDLLAAGAALRPVTDWAHYNHGYTSNILNVPELDPEAHRRSSPIEHAAGLRRPLLICAPMLDDNVFFQDAVRLVQRLIELGKTGFETAIYPVEPHAFREPASWLDEYRRILGLFERTLGPPR
jgi:dipeptidyl aminopeptidase/acylaminoacyl peptidase